jgi:hypothetical protein
MMVIMTALWGSATWLLLLVGAAACDAVIIHPPASSDDTGVGGSSVGPPSTGGAIDSGGASSASGGASTMGGESSIGGGPESGGGPSNGGGACVADTTLPNGAPVVIGAGLDRPAGIVLVGEDIYVTQTGSGGLDGEVVRLPKLGGPIEHLASGQLLPEAIVADSQYVYWVNHGGGFDGSLNRMALDDDTVEVLAQDLRYPWGIAVHEGSLFATELNNNRVLVVRPDKSLEVVSSAFTGLPIAVDETGVYVGVLGLGTWDESISRIDNQGSPSLLYPQPGPSEIVLLDGNDLYFSDEGSIRRGTRDGATAITLTEASMVGGVSGAIADCFVYFAVQEDTYVGRVPVDGGELQVLAMGQALPAAIAVDDDAIYWVNQANGTVMRLAK